MSFKKMEADLKNNNFKNICLLCGGEFFLARWAVRALTDKYVRDGFADFDLTRLDGQKDPDAAELINACETLPMMSERKLVMVEDLKDLAGACARDEKDEKELLAYLAQIPESCMLVFVCREKVDKRKKIYKRIAEYGSIYEFDKLTEADLTRWIYKRFGGLKKQIDPRLVQNLIENTGYFDKDSEYNLFNLDNDIQKIAFHAQGEVIEADDINRTVSGNVQKDVFSLIDALSREDKKHALKMLSNLMSAGESVYGVLALLFRQYEHMLKISEMKDNQETMAEIRQKLGLPDFIIKKLTSYAQKYSTAKLKKILQEAYQVDKNIKTGFLDPRLSMEMFIANV